MSSALPASIPGSLCPFKVVLPNNYLEICKRNHVNHNYIFNDKTSKEKLREKQYNKKGEGQPKIST